jgi:hypothetical protein
MTDVCTPLAIVKPVMVAGDNVHVNCGTGSGVRGHLTNPFMATVTEVNGEMCVVRRHVGGKLKTVKVPTWACTKTTAFGTMDVPAPRFRNITPAAKARIRLNVSEEMGAELRRVRAEQDKLQADQRVQQEQFQASTSNPNLNPNPNSNLNPNPMTLGCNSPGSTISCSEARRCTELYRHLEECNRER